MNRAERRRLEREAGHARSRQAKKPYWILAVCAGAGLLGVGVVAQLTDPGPHPEARVEALAPDVMEAERYSGMGRAMQAYQMAAAIPAILDGLYCYCFCSDHSGHYSLLDCFAGDHGAACDVCMREVDIAYRMTMQGESVAAIRKEIDRVYGA